MPKYDDKMLPEKDLQDIVAYLLSQEAANSWSFPAMM